MKLHFYKMQGIGNDYVYVNGFEETVPNPAELAIRVSDRHFGIGSDGLILLLPSDVADVRMQMFNADGSEGKMCGNGIRCVGKLVYELGICQSKSMMVETLSGIKSLTLTVEEEQVTSVRVDMGSPSLEIERIPVVFNERRVVNQPLVIDETTYYITCVSMGNPHAVIFMTGIDQLDLEHLGPKFEHHAMFPESVNTEFVQVVDPHHLRMRVWERGSGETLACGTGACASVVAACLCGASPRNEEVTMSLRGGDLQLCWDNDRVWMTGPATLVFSGDIEI
ncbi:MAG TPA: diaminopimelate epimerase [Ruminococcaceae bacterium]|nr:diaminopimelate epimerase [Oscillospiraceae bacterium]